MRRIGEWVILIFALGVLAVLAVHGSGEPPSTYSTYDGGRNGYEALYNVLRTEGVDVSHLQDSLGLLGRDTRVLVTTPGDAYDRSDLARLKALMRRGVRVVAFRLPDETFPAGTKLFDADRFSNVGLERNPRNALVAYRAIAGRGPVAFDERRHGYGSSQTIWSVLPTPVRVACWLVVLALVLALVGANIRFTPPLIRDPPRDRDSSSYIVAMARMLRHIGAPHVSTSRKDPS